MSPTYADFPGWIFDVDEISAGVYQVIARDEIGHQISKIGTDPDSLIKECKREVMVMFQNKI